MTEGNGRAMSCIPPRKNYGPSGSGVGEACEDNMDPLTFSRYYTGPSNLRFVNKVQIHDHNTWQPCFNHRVKSWAEGVVSADPELTVH